MSSLTRSLLALAILLVAVNAQDNCHQETYGEITDHTVTLNPVVTPNGGGRVTAEDGCASGYVEVGETVTACNDNIASGVAPSINEVNPPDFSPVDVVVPDHNTATVNITQFCAKA